MKKEYIILALIIAALSAYLVMHKTDSTHYTLPVIDNLKATTINHIDIVKGDTTLSLESNNNGDSWVVGEDKFPAKKEDVDKMIENIKNLTLTALVSESKSYNRYELDDQNKITVTAKDGDKVIRTFDVGKVASSFKHTFVKLQNDDKVYHADGNFRRNFEKKEEDLTDKTVLKLDKAMVYSLQYKEGDKALSLERKQEPVSVDVTQDKKEDKQEEEAAEPQKPKDIWADAGGAEKSKEKVDSFVSLFTILKCSNYIKGKTKDDFKDPILEITLTADKPYTVSVFPKTEEEKEYPAISSESPFSFTLPSSKVDDMKKKLEGI